MTDMRRSTGGSSWLARSGQSWKLLVGLLLFCLAGLGLVGVVWAVNTPEYSHLQFPSAAVCVLGGGAWLGWLSLALRCPNCRAPIGRVVLRTASHDRWLESLLSLEVCPRCKHAL